MKNIFFATESKQFAKCIDGFVTLCQQESNEYNFYVISTIPEINQIIKKCTCINIGHQEAIGLIGINEKRKSLIKLIYKNLKSKIKFFENTLFYDPIYLLESFLLIRKIKNKSKKIESILKKYNSSVLLINGDRDPRIHIPYLIACRSLNIKSIIPYTQAHGIQDLLLRTSQRSEVQNYSKYKCVTSKFIMKNIIGGKNIAYKNQVYYNTVDSYVLSLLNAHPDNPWILGSGISDYVCVQTEAERNRLIDYLGGNTKIVMNGHVLLDRLNAACEKKLILRSKFLHENIKKKIILCSLPQLKEHNWVSSQVHWEIINRLVKILSKSKSIILFSLHPKMTPDDYEWINNIDGCHILNEELIDIIPAADALVSLQSTVVGWSILAGVNAIILDFLLPENRLYSGKESSLIRIASSFDDLEFIIENEISENDGEGLKSEMLDGKVTKKYLSLFG